MNDIDVDAVVENGGGEEGDGENDGPFFMMCGNLPLCGKTSDTIE